MVADSSTSGGGLAVPAAELDHILDRVDRLAGQNWRQAGAPIEDLLATVEQVQRRLTGIESEIVAVAESENAWAAGGFRSSATWLQALTGSTRSAASRTIRLSRALQQDLLLTQEALGQGQIGREHAQILQRETTRSEKLREQLTDDRMGEGFLIGMAEKLDADDFRKAVKHWAGMADPEAADRNWREESENEEVFLSVAGDVYYINGRLNMTTGRALETALTAQMGRKAEDDDRTPAQRRAAALGSWAYSWLDSGDLKPGARIRPHLSVHVPFETLQAMSEATGSAVPPGRTFTPGASAFQTLRAPGGPKEMAGKQEFDAEVWARAWKPGEDHTISTALDYDRLRGLPPATLDDGTPLAPSALSRIACGSKLTRIVFGARSTIIDVGREQRIFPANQTRAIIARDRHCQFPACSEPPEFGEIHHALWWWKHGGKTSTDQGILLCWWHHAHVHDKQIMIARIDGAWVFSTDQGRVITGIRDRAGLGKGLRIRSSGLDPGPGCDDPPDNDVSRQARRY